MSETNHNENDKNGGIERIKLITCIADRGRGKIVMKLCKREGISSSMLIHGRGTADSEMLAMLGLGESEKDVVILTIGETKCEKVLNMIAKELHMDEPGNGIAFSIPLSAVASQYNSYLSILGDASLFHKQIKGEHHDEI